MSWLNEYEIETAVSRFRNDPVLGPATRFLSDFRDEVNQHSDGWPYWSAPSKAAGKLMELIHAHHYAGLGAYPRQAPATAKQVRATLTPIKSFMTRRGYAAGMKMPDIKLPG